MQVKGQVDEGFGPLADAFAAVLPEDGRGGGALALYVDGELVASLWGGAADARTGREWEEGTATQVFSAAKGILSVLLHRLAQEGRLDLDAPVAQYWPEFADGGKEAVTVRTVLAHRAGLPVVDASLSFEDVLAWAPVVEALEKQVPLWEPGTAHAYHGMTLGWLAGELVRRVTGLTPGAYFRESIGDPLDLATWFALPEEEAARLARLELPDQQMQLPADALITRTLTLNGAVDFPGDWGSFPLLGAEIPAGSAVSSARGLAAVYAAAATGLGGQPRLLGRQTVTDALREQSSGPSWPGDMPDFGGRWGTGFMIDSNPVWRPLGARSFGHDGAGGNTAFGDDEFGVGFAFVTSRMVGPGDDRANRLTAALRGCLG
ncbi:CubicO group peptidase (beta-lactamase class C family) [Streptomyces olivoverticillatus]|uniref:CubicO group peptidase (Beta-lactamase class C family) n=1 Tax=Streptomyces olivoverticillatus TaxID=66427 RepID=A0A7W7LJX0_9ACTN|nr:serine hydrolase domain-containing protein [Streptomyces olivoverticillatus]MBB4891217.1 CubicO group peptidase (beta-lactamase class C family) [Streptomyces olivoverticillatus]